MIYFKYIRMVILSFLQYRLNLLLSIFGQVLATLSAFAGIYLMFARFGAVDGWSFDEVALCFAVVMAAFSLTECFMRGFDLFSSSVKSGDFDRLLLRPRSTVLQIMGGNFEITRIGRLILSAVVLVHAIPNLSIAWTASKIVTLCLMILSGTLTFSGIFILGATVCFWTTEGLEFINILTNGGRELSSYPLTIYTKWLRRFFTFIIPFGCMNYLPLMYITGRTNGNPVLYILAPLIGCVFIVPCIFVWNYGVKHYLSTGS
jgi:ABC-2 type transport system permease protein